MADTVRRGGGGGGGGMLQRLWRRRRRRRKTRLAETQLQRLGRWSLGNSALQLHNPWRGLVWVGFNRALTITTQLTLSQQPRTLPTLVFVEVLTTQKAPGDWL
jgi:hypothetical protein